MDEVLRGNLASMDEVLRDDLASAEVESSAPESGRKAVAVVRVPAPGEAAAMASLMQLVVELNSLLDLDEVLRKVADNLKQHLNYDTFGIHLLDPLGQELRIRFGVGYPQEVIEHWRLGLGQGLVGTAAKTRQPVRVGDVSRDARYINAGDGIASELAIPLVVKNRTIGVLDIGSRQADFFTETHQRLLTFLAGHLATAIENAGLYENLREQSRTLSLLHEVSRGLTSILDREELLRRIAQAVKHLVDYQLFSVMLWNEETQRLEHTFLLRHGERIVGVSGLPLGHGLCGTAAMLRQPVRVPNVHLDPRYVRCEHETDVVSELVVPLVFKDRLVGVLELESTSYNAFSEQHEQILVTLASYIAIALENARLYEQVRADEQLLQNDLAMARKIQQRLLPQATPRLPGLDLAVAYAPARQLGGDVYDFLPCGEGRLAVAVGDVAGKATAAALYGSLAIGMLRGHVVAHPCPPAEMLELMNRQLRQPPIDSRFIALALSVYDSRTKSLTLANAGFPRPLLVRGGQVEPIRVEGVPLGLLPDSCYEERQVALQAGDVIAFYSDGIVECVDKREEEFGLERLKATLAERAAAGSARQVADAILEATDRYTAGNGPESRPGQAFGDDRTVVVLKVSRE